MFLIRPKVACFCLDRRVDHIVDERCEACACVVGRLRSELIQRVHPFCISRPRKEMYVVQGIRSSVAISCLAVWIYAFPLMAYMASLKEGGIVQSYTVILGKGGEVSVESSSVAVACGQSTNLK